MSASVAAIWLAWPAPDAHADPLEVPIGSYTNNAFPGYTVTGVIRTDVSGNIYAFSPSNFPNSPATVINLTPAVPGAKTLVQSFQATHLNQTQCVTIIVEICGGVRVFSDIDLYHFEAPYAMSVQGVVDVDALTATATPVPKTSDLHVQIVADTRVQFLGLFDSLPDFLKDAMSTTANAVAAQFGTGHIDVRSTITGFDPVTVSAIVDKLPALTEITIDWTDILITFADPDVAPSGSVTLNVLQFVVTSPTGPTVLDAAIELISKQLVLALEGELPCPTDSPENCIRVPGEQLTFLVPSSDQSTAVPAPSVLAMLILGFAAGALRRRCSLGHTANMR